MTDEETLLQEDTKRVFTEKKDFIFSTIKDLFDEHEIIPQPDYQRNYVMDDKQASRLIESILMGIPIPTVYLCEENDNTYSIIDWQQRMTSIVRFMKNEFALKGLEELSELNGKKYWDLSQMCKRTIKNWTLSAIILTKESQELKYEIFARLNQGSIKLKPQELRNCIYRWSFNNLIEELAETNKYLQVLFKDDNKRKDYQERILRFFALRNFYDYSSSMTKTLNNFMWQHQNDSKEEIDIAREQFNSTIWIIKQVLWDTAFCAYDRQRCEIMNKFSGSIYDSIVIAFSHFDSHDLMVHADAIREKINEMKTSNETYQDYTYAATGSKSRVIWRITMIDSVIRNIIWEKNPAEWWRSFSLEDKKSLWYEWYICPYCNQQILSIDDAEVDHIIPYSKWWTTTFDNAQLLHRHCNRVKNAAMDDLEDFEEDREE